MTSQQLQNCNLKQNKVYDTKEDMNQKLERGKEGLYGTE